jgi:polyphosphate kinase
MTDKFYTYINLFTCKTKFGMDVYVLFNSLKGYSGNSKYQNIIISTNYTRSIFKKMIDFEIENSKKWSTEQNNFSN